MRGLVLPVAALTLALTGCGGSSAGTASSAGAASSIASAGPSGSGSAVPAATAPAGCASASAGPVATGGTTDLSKKPVITVPTGPPPCTLVVGDIVRGSGPPATSGEQLTVKYVGALYTTGKQFDASWDRSQDFPFTLGAGSVIPGWDRGLVGMRVGGRRELIIPPALGYGPQGAGADIPPNATLVFVVDLVKIG